MCFAPQTPLQGMTTRIFLSSKTVKTSRISKELEVLAANVYRWIGYLFGSKLWQPVAEPLQLTFHKPHASLSPQELGISQFHY